MKTFLTAALTAVGLMTCACTSQGSSATPQATVTVTAHAQTAVTSSPPAQASQPAGTAPAAAPAGAQAPAPAPPPAPCLTRYLGAKTGLSQGGLGSTYVVIVFKNLNNYPCSLYGYPGVALDAGKPATEVGLAAAENPATPRELVILGPHKDANALLRIVEAASYPPTKCKPVATQWLQIIPPNQTVPIYLGYTSTACAKPVRILTVDAVRPGSGG
ncbi:MAG TPA: hypothetical protein DHU96_21640 [Actinobacteria bacterium]|nr:hypothetical protein [Actinomycetota bacterium]